MSPALLLELRTGFDERLAGLGQRFKLERTGDEWDGILLAVPPIHPILDPGADKREKATMEARRDGLPNIKYGDIILQKQPFWAVSEDTPAPRWRVIERSDNPADFAIKYWLVKIAEQDDGFNP